MVSIKRDWRGDPVEISTEEGAFKSFLIAYKDDAGFWNNDIKKIEFIDDIPAAMGLLQLWIEELRRVYWKAQAKKKHAQDKTLVTPRDGWDLYKDIDKKKYKKDILDRHPQAPVEKKEPELKGDKDSS